MLRASSETIGATVSADAVAGDVDTVNVAHGAELVSFVDAVISGDARQSAAARAALADTLGPAAVAEAAAVIANFEMMTRVADGTGARLPAAAVDGMADIRARLGMDEFASANH